MPFVARKSLTLISCMVLPTPRNRPPVMCLNRPPCTRGRTTMSGSTMRRVVLPLSREGAPRGPGAPTMSRRWGIVDR